MAMGFNEGKIIEIFYVEKKGRKIPVILRYPKKNDMRGIWKFYNKVIRETEFLSRITPVSLKDEKKWLAGVLDGIKKKNKVQLFAESDGKIIGSVSVEKRTIERRRHVGGYGICILQGFTGLGIGKRMTQAIEKEAKNLDIEMLELSVYGRNKIAQGMYRKMGYTPAGRIPCAIKVRKGFDDEIIMYKVLK